MISEGIKKKLILAGWFPSVPSYDKMHKHIGDFIVEIAGRNLVLIDKRNGSTAIYDIETLSDACEIMAEHNIEDKKLKN